MHRTGLLGIISVLLLAGCGGVSGALTVDDSVEIVAPTPMEVVTTPFEIRWNGDLADDETFAVFVDRDPVAPGRSLAETFEDDCDGAAGCPDDEYLVTRGIFVTDDHELSVRVLNPRGGVDGAPRFEVHHATIVVLGPDGSRRGERAWGVEFRVDR